MPSRLEFAVSCIYIPRTTDASNAYNRSICQEQTRRIQSTTGRTFCSEWNSQPHHIRLSRVDHGKTGTGGANERWQAAPHKHGRRFKFGVHAMRPTHNDERVREPLSQDYEGLGMLWICWFCDMARAAGRITCMKFEALPEP